jgi:hypothetical protein
MRKHAPGGKLVAPAALTALALTAPIWVAAATGAAAQRDIPNFASSEIGWLTMYTDYMPVPGEPGPTRVDPANPYVPNGTGRQPTFRIADLTDPNIKPWANYHMPVAMKPDF